MSVGDVHTVSFPPRGGHEQAGRRPAIIVQSESASARIPTVLCIPFTSQLDALRFPGTVLVDPDGSNGLQRPSIALAFQLTAIDQRHLGPRLGSLSALAMSAIWKAFDELTERALSSPTGGASSAPST